MGYVTFYTRLGAEPRGRRSDLAVLCCFHWATWGLNCVVLLVPRDLVIHISPQGHIIPLRLSHSASQETGDHLGELSSSSRSIVRSLPCIFCGIPFCLESCDSSFVVLKGEC